MKTETLDFRQHVRQLGFNDVGVLPVDENGNRGFIRTAFTMQLPASNMGSTDGMDRIFTGGKPEEGPQLGWRMGWSVPLWSERWYQENDEQNRINWVNQTPQSNTEDIRLFNSFYTTAPKPTAWVCPSHQPTPKHKQLVQGGCRAR